MDRLVGKVALITGGARGQGAAEAQLFVSEGARVVIGDLLDEDGIVLAKTLGENCSYTHLDVTKSGDWKQAVAHVVDTFGGLDVLVNNAGKASTTRLADTDEDAFMKVVRVNQLGTFLGLQAVIEPMTRRAGGSVVNISSVAGLRGLPGGIAYGASKFAVTGMTKIAALELASSHIRVNSVHPGFIDTKMLTDLIPATYKDTFGRMIPIGAIAQPEDIAHMVVFLASDESRYCTGAEFVVDGGVTAGLSYNLTL